MADPIQAGNQLVAKPAPTFADFVVVDDTWRERDSLTVNETLDGASETYNYAGANPGADITCELVLKVKDPVVAPLEKLDVVATTETVPRYLVVVDVENMSFGGRVLKQSVSFAFRSSLQATLTPAP